MDLIAIVILMYGFCDRVSATGVEDTNLVALIVVCASVLFMVSLVIWLFCSKQLFPGLRRRIKESIREVLLLPNPSEDETSHYGSITTNSVRPAYHLFSDASDLPRTFPMVGISRPMTNNPSESRPPDYPGISRAGAKSSRKPGVCNPAPGYHEDQPPSYSEVVHVWAKENNRPA